MMNGQNGLTFWNNWPWFQCCQVSQPMSKFNIPTLHWGQLGTVYTTSGSFPGERMHSWSPLGEISGISVRGLNSPFLQQQQYLSGPVDTIDITSHKGLLDHKNWVSNHGDVAWLSITVKDHGGSWVYAMGIHEPHS